MQGGESRAGQTTQIDQFIDASKKQRSKSKVWKEFTSALDGHSAECKHCQKHLSAKSSGGTSHLSRHLKICPARLGTIHKQTDSSPPRTPEELPRPTNSNLCPFPTMSSAGFRQVLAGMYPNSSIISHIATEEQFIAMFQNESLKLKEKLSLTPGGVSLSVNRWDLEGNSFVCLSVHFIDGEWQMHRKIIRCFCSELIDGQPGKYIGVLPNWKSFRYSNDFNGVPQTVSEYHLHDKLLGIALPQYVDNKMILDLEKTVTGHNYLLAKCKLIDIPCSVDALHRMLISVPNDVIQKTSENWFDYMTCSPLRKKKYQQVLSRMCLHRPSFGSKTWYSTFFLMEAILQFNMAFPNLEQMDSIMYPPKPSFESLEAAHSFCKVARPIYHAIRVISSSRSALNSYFHALWSVRTTLHESSGKSCMERVLGIKDMLEKFDKHWQKLYLWLSVAVVLDPRYKFRFLEDCFRRSCGNGARMYISEVQGNIYGLFFRYSCRAGQSSRNDKMQMNTQGRDQLDGNASQNYNEQTAHEALRELHMYLDGELCPPNDANYLSTDALSQDSHFDILKWWKANASIYPALAALARDVLAISGCAVSAESAFNETDEQVHLFNRKLSHEMVEAVICMHDWFQGSGMTIDADGGNCSMPM